MFKAGMVVKQKEDNRLIVLFEVTQEDIDNGTNTDHVGLHGFAGCWHNGDYCTSKPYGKIFHLGDESEYEVIHLNIADLDEKEVRSTI